MKRFIEVDEAVEKLLVSVFDAALKQGGFSMQGTIQSIINAIKTENIPPPIAPQ